jgi:AcrR family transcriptional regulator
MLYVVDRRSVGKERRCIIPRIVKEYDERYSQFLDTAQQLFFTKGYAQTSVQAIIRAVGVAKGTFYHYFDSKTDILEAIIERIAEQITMMLQRIVEDSTLSPQAKLEQFFTQSNQWKVMRKEQLLETGRAIYMDENVLLRERLLRVQTVSFVPMIAQIIEEGVSNRVFDVTHPAEVAELIIVMVRVLGESIVRLLLEQDDNITLEQIHRQIQTCNRSVERVLGMTSGNLTLIDQDAIDAWFLS